LRESGADFYAIWTLQQIQLSITRTIQNAFAVLDFVWQLVHKSKVFTVSLLDCDWDNFLTVRMVVWFVKCENKLLECELFKTQLKSLVHLVFINTTSSTQMVSGMPGGRTGT